MTRVANILTAAGLAACSGAGYSPTDPGNPSPSGQTLSVRVGETAAVGTTGVTIAFDAVVSDSRCPLDVLCVWAGNGQLALTLTNGYGATTVDTLNTTVEPRKTDFAGLEILLQGLAPYPTGEPIDPGDYVATFRVDAD
jgi:hypothetical protein